MAYTSPPTLFRSIRGEVLVCRNHARKLSDLESGISLPQVSFMSTMQTQALFAVLCDFDLADSRRGFSVDEAASLCAKLRLRLPESGNKCVLQSQMFSVMEDVHKGPEHPLSKALREE